MLTNHRDIPRYIPNYNLVVSCDIQYAVQKKKHLFAYKNCFNNGIIRPITSDDELLVLDTGWSIAIKNSINDCINDNYAINDYKVNTIGSRLTAHGIYGVN